MDTALPWQRVQKHFIVKNVLNAKIREFLSGTMSERKADDESFEETLICDDLFYEYFSAFLSLPCFPYGIQYNRLSGFFELDPSLIDGSSPAIVVQRQSNGVWAPAGTSVFGKPTEESRREVMRWIQTYRLRLFLRSSLFREYKLSQTILKKRKQSASLLPVERKHRSGSGSRSNSCSSIGSVTETSKHGTLVAGDEKTGSKSRMGSVPPILQGKLSGKTSTQQRSSEVTTSSVASSKRQSDKTSEAEKHSQTVDPDDETTKSGQQTSSAGTAGESYFKRVVSAPSSQDLKASRSQSASHSLEKSQEDTATTESDVEGDADGEGSVGNQTYLIDPASQTSASIIEPSQHKHINELSHRLLGNISGMQSFRCFLEGTTGSSLYNFWLDCEELRDADDSGASKLELRKIFRHILEKYRHLMPDTMLVDFFQKNSPDSRLLRPHQREAAIRLQLYWIPRYALHLERVGLGMSMCSNERNGSMSAHSRQQTTMLDMLAFPRLALGSWVCSLHDIGLWTTIDGDSADSDYNSASSLRSAGGKRLDPISSKHSLLNKCISALMYEQLGGHPLAQWAIRERRQQLEMVLAFYQDILRLATLTRSQRSDRLHLRERYWTIYNRYIRGEESCPGKVASRIYAQLIAADGRELQLSPVIFSEPQLLMLEAILPDWLDFVRQDAIGFLGPQIMIDNLEIASTNETLVVILPSTVKRSKSATRKLTGESPVSDIWDMEAQARWNRWLADQRRTRERYRLEALRAAYGRMQAQRKAAADANRSTRIMELRQRRIAWLRQHEREEAARKPKAAPLVPQEETDAQLLEKLLGNKTLLAMMKRNAESGEPEIADLLTLFQAIEALCAAKDAEPAEKTGKEKDSPAVTVFKQFLDPKSSMRTSLEAAFGTTQEGSAVRELVQRISNGTLIAPGQFRPPSAALRDLRNIIHTRLAKGARQFVVKQSASFGVDPARMMAMTPETLRQRYRASKVDQATTSVTNRQNRSRSLSLETPDEDLKLTPLRQPGQGKAQVTRDDRAELLQLVGLSSMGLPSRLVVAFRQYLAVYGELDKLPQLENDLVFVLEAQKYKTACHPDQDEQFLKRKLNAFVDIFLESASPPACQVNLNSDYADRLVKTLRRAATTLEFGSGLLDEASSLLMASHLYSYFAGFRKNFQEDREALDNVLSQPSRRARILQQRLKTFNEWQPPPPLTYKRLPPLPDKSTTGFSQAIFTLHFTIADGISWKEQELRGPAAAAAALAQLGMLKAAAAAAGTTHSQLTAATSNAVAGTSLT